MKFSFHPEAEREFNRQIDWYEERQAGLGERFSSGLNATIDKIMAHPKAWTQGPGDIRKALVKNFPYTVRYRYVEKPQEEIFIVAIAGDRRNPDYWKNRI